jgi:DNA-binding NarL/FixJ family response regulator
MYAPIPQGPADNQTTILIVDDDVPFCRAAAELLADRGFRVVGHARTAREAVVACRRLAPDGILLDVRLPDGHGVQLASALRDGPSPPTIVLTSSDTAAVLPEQLRLSGASAFIPKSQLARSDLERVFKDSDAPA